MPSSKLLHQPAMGYSGFTGSGIRVLLAFIRTQPLPPSRCGNFRNHGNFGFKPSKVNYPQVCPAHGTLNLTNQEADLGIEAWGKGSWGFGATQWALGTGMSPNHTEVNPKPQAPRQNHTTNEGPRTPKSPWWHRVALGPQKHRR